MGADLEDSAATGGCCDQAGSSSKDAGDPSDNSAHQVGAVHVYR